MARWAWLGVLFASLGVSPGAWADATSPAIMQKLQLHEPVISHPLGQQPNPRQGIAQTIRILQHQPRTNRPVVWSMSERTMMAQLQGRDIAGDVAYLSAPELQARVDSTHASLAHVMQTHFGVQPASHGDRIAVYQPSNPYQFSASTLADGSIVMHERVLSVADEIGVAVAAAHDGKEVAKNINDVRLGRYVRPANVDRVRAKQISEGFVAFIVGHEMSHGWREDGPNGLFGNKKRVQRAAETVSDAGGIELATRGRYSLVGQAAAVAYIAMMGAEVRKPNVDKGGHPAGVKRYDFVYRYWDRRKDKPSIVYENGEKSSGGPFLSPEQRTEFELLPSPEDIVAVVEAARQQNSPPKVDSKRIIRAPRWPRR